jgi:glycosyltransferase involved in cell wall biosynthesis
MTINMDSLCSRDQGKFLYFGGNGNIVKGLDLVIEAFSELPEVELYICAPKNEEDFNAAYQDILARSKNIHFLGFIKVGGDTFNRVTSECGYVIFPSCSEGTASSVVTCMRRGLIPIVTYESGIDLDDFGYLIEDIHIEALKSRIKNISKEHRKDFNSRSIKTYFNSFNYTQAKFSEIFEKAIIHVLTNKKDLHK